jgi:hypothetical protein
VENQVQALKAGVYNVRNVDVRPVATREVEPDYPPGLAPILTGKAIPVGARLSAGMVATGPGARAPLPRRHPRPRGARRANTTPAL